MKTMHISQACKLVSDDEQNNKGVSKEPIEKMMN